jgi:hypothetical protein
MNLHDVEDRIDGLNLAPIVDAAIQDYTSHGYSIGSYVEKHSTSFERVAFADDDERFTP